MICVPVPKKKKRFRFTGPDGTKRRFGPRQARTDGKNKFLYCNIIEYLVLSSGSYTCVVRDNTHDKVLFQVRVANFLTNNFFFLEISDDVLANIFFL